jgi:hypothetical protein
LGRISGLGILIPEIINHSHFFSKYRSCRTWFLRFSNSWPSRSLRCSVCGYNSHGWCTSHRVRFRLFGAIGTCRFLSQRWFCPAQWVPINALTTWNFSFLLSYSLC